MSLFDGMSREQLADALGEAQAALIRLQTGDAAVSLSYAQGDGSKSITKRVTTVGECTQLILQLKQALGVGARRRMIGFVLR